jgi:hypothetical protein
MLSRIKDIYARSESTEGTYVDPLSSAYSLIAFDVSDTDEHEEIPRDTSGSSLSKGKTVFGRSMKKLTFGLDFKGEGATATVPDRTVWGPLMLACGMQEVRLYKLGCSGGIVDGAPIVHGDTLYEGTPALDLAYGGAAADMVVTVSSGVISAASVSTPGDNFSFDTSLEANNTLTELAGVIDAETNWTCAVNAGATGGHDSSQLLPGSFAIAGGGGTATVGYYNGTPATGIAVGAYTYAVSGGHTSVIYEPSVGTFANADKVYCNCLNTFTATADPAANGYAYRPISVVKHMVTTSVAGWTAGATNEVGEIVKGTKTGSNDCYVRLLTGSGLATGSAQTLYYEPIIGAMEDGMTLTGTTNADTATVDGTPAPVANYTYSLAQLLDGMVEKARGCRGSFTLDLKAGSPALIKFEFTGLSEGVDDEPAPAAGLTDPGTPLRFHEANFSVDALAMRTAKAELALGANLVVRSDANEEEGGQSLMISDRDPKLSIDPEMVPDGVYSWRDKLKDSTLVEIKIRMGNAENVLGKATHSVGNGIWLDIPSGQVLAVSKGDRDGILTGEVEIACRTAGTTGDDEFTIYHV